MLGLLIIWNGRDEAYDRWKGWLTSVFVTMPGICKISMVGRFESMERLTVHESLVIGDNELVVFPDNRRYDLTCVNGTNFSELYRTRVSDKVCYRNNSDGTHTRKC